MLVLLVVLVWWEICFYKVVCWVVFCVGCFYLYYVCVVVGLFDCLFWF